MKTFETEKHNIPEGATHYSNEEYGKYFCWYKDVDGKGKIMLSDGRGFSDVWWDCEHNEHLGVCVKPIPQTNVETPEEKEVLDSIKPREMTQPIISKCETVFSFSHGERRFILRGIDTDHPQLEVVRHETEQQREERERLEAAKAMGMPDIEAWFWELDSVDKRNEYRLNTKNKLAGLISQFKLDLVKSGYRKESN